jgi:hypothetical protein
MKLVLTTVIVQDLESTMHFYCTATDGIAYTCYNQLLYIFVHTWLLSRRKRSQVLRSRWRMAQLRSARTEHRKKVSFLTQTTLMKIIFLIRNGSKTLIHSIIVVYIVAVIVTVIVAYMRALSAAHLKFNNVDRMRLM